MRARMMKVAGLLLAGALVFGVAYTDKAGSRVDAETTGASAESRIRAEETVEEGFGSSGVAAAISESLSNAELVAVQVSQTDTDTTAAGQEETQEETEEISAEPETICGYTNLGIAQVEGNLNVREGAGTDYDIAGKMQNNAGCEVLGTEGEWSLIRSGKVEGYVKSEFLVTGDAAASLAEEIKQTIATVIEGTVTLYVREEPNTDCNIVTMVPDGEELEVIELLDGWAKVAVDNAEGYVNTDYVTISEQLPKAQTLTELRYGQGVSDVRVDLVQYALQFVGNPYVWGGTSLTNGADCSGFVLSVFANYGISLPHHSGSQAGYGTAISTSEARPGDLFFYSSGGAIDHVAIYIGNGQVVHASSPTTGIKISNAYYRTPVKAVNLLGD